MNNSNTIPPIITLTMGAGKTSSPYFYDMNLTQKLCKKACADEVPIFDPSFTYLGVMGVGTNQYIASFRVDGVIYYTPCGCNSCATTAQKVSQEFTIPIYSTTDISNVAITISSQAVNVIAKNPCEQCSSTFVSEIPLTVTVTTA